MIRLGMGVVRMRFVWVKVRVALPVLVHFQ